MFKKDSEIDKELVDLENHCRLLINVSAGCIFENIHFARINRMNKFQDITNVVSLPKVVDLTKRQPGTLPTSLKDDPKTFLIKEVHQVKTIKDRLTKLEVRSFMLAFQMKS